MTITWEIFRGRRLKNCLDATAVPSALREILSPLVDAQAYSEWMNTLVKQWTAQKPSAIKRVNKYLASKKLTFDGGGICEGNGSTYCADSYGCESIVLGPFAGSGFVGNVGS